MSVSGDTKVSLTWVGFVSCKESPHPHLKTSERTLVVELSMFDLMPKRKTTTLEHKFSYLTRKHFVTIYLKFYSKSNILNTSGIYLKYISKLKRQNSQNGTAVVQTKMNCEVQLVALRGFLNVHLKHGEH